MEMKDKAFADYCNGYELEEISKRRKTPIGTIKCWMYRYHWKDRKQGLFSSDGKIDRELLSQYMSGKGNLAPAISNSDPDEYMLSNPRDREKAMRLKNALMASIEYLTNTAVASTEEAEQRIISYFEMCIEFTLHPSFEGLCGCLGISKTTYYDWMTGKSRGKLGTVSPDLLKKAKLCLAEAEGQSARNGDIPYVLYMFIAKNHYDMKDQVDTVVTHTTQNLESPEEIARRFDAETPIEDAEYTEIIDVEYPEND